MSTTVRRTGRTLALSALALALCAPMASAAPQDAASAGATTWSTAQLSGGLVHNDQYDFDDHGLTADFGIAFAEAGEKKLVRRTSRALAGNVAAYTGSGTEIYAGSTAKLAVFAQRSGADARSFGGTDLIAQIEERVATSGTTAGRISDLSEYGDYANALGQVYAVEALSNAGSTRAKPALKFLLAQQCRSGAFRLNFADPTASAQGCDAAKGAAKAADTDVTALAALTLGELAKPTAATKKAHAKAIGWLAKRQTRNGSFGGGVDTEAPNANSTGLAAWALADAGRCAPARRAASWVRTLQVPANAKGKLKSARGALAYDKAALKAAASAGITAEAADQWRRATAQALPGLSATQSCVAGR